MNETNETYPYPVALTARDRAAAVLAGICGESPVGLYQASVRSMDYFAEATGNDDPYGLNRLGEGGKVVVIEYLQQRSKALQELNRVVGWLRRTKGIAIPARAGDLAWAAETEVVILTGNQHLGRAVRRLVELAVASYDRETVGGT